MSLFCPREACKVQSGMCKCEIIMTLVIALVAVYLLIRHFA